MGSVDFEQGLVKALENITDASEKKEIMLAYIDFIHDKGKKKAEALSLELKRKVRYAVYTGDEKTEACICYYTSPKTEVKLRCTDLVVQSPSRAAKALFEATILKNESDARVFKQDEDDDFFFLAALDDCTQQWRKADILVKKK